jgi:hypothetical protein
LWGCSLFLVVLTVEPDDPGAKIEATTRAARHDLLEAALKARDIRAQINAGVYWIWALLFRQRSAVVVIPVPLEAFERKLSKAGDLILIAEDLIVDGDKVVLANHVPPLIFRLTAIRRRVSRVARS